VGSQLSGQPTERRAKQQAQKTAGRRRAPGQAASGGQYGLSLHLQGVGTPPSLKRAGPKGFSASNEVK